METKQLSAFFVLRGHEAATVGAVCVQRTNEILQKQVDKELPTDIAAAFDRLNGKIDSLDTHNPQDIILDVYEALAFQYAYMRCTYWLKDVIDHKTDSKNFDSTVDVELQQFELLRNNAGDVLWRLIQCLDYNELMLSMLEAVFGIKTGVVRKLMLNNTDDVWSFMIDEENSSVFGFIFMLFQMFEKQKENSHFARQVYTHQYINIEDLRHISTKLLLTKKGDQLWLTKRETVCLYWVICLSQRMFTTDALAIIEARGKSMPDGMFDRFKTYIFENNTVLLQEMYAAGKIMPEITAYFDAVDKWEF